MAIDRLSIPIQENPSQARRLDVDASDFVLFDTHCHLDLDQFAGERDAILAHARDSGVRFIVNPGIDLGHSQQAIALAERYREVYAAVGVHPNSSQTIDETTIDALRNLADHSKVVAIGEIGLDYHWDKVEPTRQKQAFRLQLSLAAELGLPVIIHSRDSNDDVAKILSEWVRSTEFLNSPLTNRPFAGVLHAFSGDIGLARQAYDWNFVLSLGGPVTFKNARVLHELIPKLALDRLMLETDAPFLTPHPYRGKRNEPAYVALVCQKLTDLYESSVDEIAASTTKLACSFFQIRNKA
ncbi:TatD family hydrolase [Chloroflexi bacterium TSY]|nr:TatD family hydrolase [Chloroflexi bacterium TSY]